MTGPNDFTFYQGPEYRQVSTERQRIRYPALSAAADNHPDGYSTQRFAKDLLRLAQDVLETWEFMRAETFVRCAAPYHDQCDHTHYIRAEGKPQPPLNAGESLNLALKTIEEMAAEGKPQ